MAVTCMYNRELSDSFRRLPDGRREVNQQVIYIAVTITCSWCCYCCKVKLILLYDYAVAGSAGEEGRTGANRFMICFTRIIMRGGCTTDFIRASFICTAGSGRQNQNVEGKYVQQPFHEVQIYKLFSCRLIWLYFLFLIAFGGIDFGRKR